MPATSSHSNLSTLHPERSGGACSPSKLYGSASSCCNQTSPQALLFPQCCNGLITFPQRCCDRSLPFLIIHHPSSRGTFAKDFLLTSCTAGCSSDFSLLRAVGRVAWLRVVQVKDPGAGGMQGKRRNRLDPPLQLLLSTHPHSIGLQTPDCQQLKCKVPASWKMKWLLPSSINKVCWAPRLCWYL